MATELQLARAKLAAQGLNVCGNGLTRANGRCTYCQGKEEPCEINVGRFRRMITLNAIEGILTPSETEWITYPTSYGYKHAVEDKFRGAEPHVYVSNGEFILYLAWCGFGLRPEVTGKLNAQIRATV